MRFSVKIENKRTTLVKDRRTGLVRESSLPETRKDQVGTDVGIMNSILNFIQ